MFKFFKKKINPEINPEVYLVRLFHRYRSKADQQFTEGYELKAFTSEQKAISFIKEKGLTLTKNKSGGVSWRKAIKEDMEGYSAFIDKLKIE